MTLRSLMTNLSFAGSIDRTMLGEEFSCFLNDTRLQKAAKLKTFGDLMEVKILNQSERGGMETSSIQFIFP